MEAPTRSQTDVRLTNPASHNLQSTTALGVASNHGLSFNPRHIDLEPFMELKLQLFSHRKNSCTAAITDSTSESVISK